MLEYRVGSNGDISAGNRICVQFKRKDDGRSERCAPSDGRRFVRRVDCTCRSTSLPCLFPVPQSSQPAAHGGVFFFSCSFFREEPGERPESSTGLWDLMSPAIHRRLPSRRCRRRHGGSEMEPTLHAVHPVIEGALRQE